MSDGTKPDNRTHAQKRHAERREAMREWLAGRGYLDQIGKDLDRDIADDELPVVKFKTETRLKLLAKILPDVTESKNEHSGPDGGPVQVEKIVREIVRTTD